MMTKNSVGVERFPKEGIQPGRTVVEIEADTTVEGAIEQAKVHWDADNFEVEVNGVKASLNDAVRNGDEITIILNKQTGNYLA